MNALERRVLLSRMETAYRQTQSHLDLVERQIARRAERITVTTRAKGRSFHRHGPSWTLEDERTYRGQIEAIAFERRAELDALSRKLMRQERALAVLRSRQPVPGVRAA